MTVLRVTKIKKKGKKIEKLHDFKEKPEKEMSADKRMVCAFFFIFTNRRKIGVLFSDMKTNAIFTFLYSYETETRRRTKDFGGKFYLSSFFFFFFKKREFFCVIERFVANFDGCEINSM